MIPKQFLDYSKEIGGIGDCPGYASGGGTIFNREHYMDSYERILDKFTDVYDEFCKINKIFGWEDFLFQYIFMLGGYEVTFKIMIYVNCGKCLTFHEFEILTGCKDPNLITL